jgi:CRP/FNR family transcriptional regulator, cyclic AMP receptor protein
MSNESRRRTPAPARQIRGKPSNREANRRGNLSRKRDFEIALAALRRFRSFSWLAQDKLEELASGVTLLRFKRQQLIFPNERLPMTDIYIVMSGAMRAGLVNRRGRRVTIEIEEPGHVVGGFPLDPIPDPGYFIEALSGTVLGRVSRAHFLKVTQPGNPENFGHVMESMVRGLWQAFDRYANFAGERMQVRLIEELLELGAKFAVRDARGVILNVRVTRKDLGDVIGASRQLVSVLLNDLEAQGAIERERHRLILRESKLQELLMRTSRDNGKPPGRQTRSQKAAHPVN